MEIALSRRCIAEFFGTFWLVFGGCGAAILACGFPAFGIGFVGVALAFGLTVLTMAYAIGHISGCHLNPAVTLGLVAGKRFPAKELLPYWISQVIGGIAAAGVLYVIASGKTDYAVGGFASNGLRPQHARRLWVTRRLQPDRLPGSRGRVNLLLPGSDPGRNRPARGQGVCAAGDRPLPDTDSPHWPSR